MLLILLPAFPTLSMAPVILIFTALMVLSIVSHVKAMVTNPVSVCEVDGGFPTGEVGFLKNCFPSGNKSFLLVQWVSTEELKCSIKLAL